MKLVTVAALLAALIPSIARGDQTIESVKPPDKTAPFSSWTRSDAPRVREARQDDQVPD
jgi:hypothetical protein